ncbi:hypothetical protein Cni_G27070 [Canna indica]|uniref:Uncharacterized protein n=1 Tax=Canna indica TaxID=4628 RepID=A0AAQ3L382_9LILI|nr:hypothetical protein Cni_G27070 [Canna indica]
MGIFRRIASFLGLTPEEEDEEAAAAADARHSVSGGRTGASRGVGVHFPVAAERPNLGPVVIPCDPSEGGVQTQDMHTLRISLEIQIFCSILTRKREHSIYSLILVLNLGFKWYTRRLRIDEDGDVADEFLGEVITEKPTTDSQIVVLPKLEVNYDTRPTALAMRNQVIVADGNIRQSIECQGSLQWV